MWIFSIYFTIMKAALELCLRLKICKTKQVDLLPPVLMLFSECQGIAKTGVARIYPAVIAGWVGAPSVLRASQ